MINAKYQIKTWMYLKNNVKLNKIKLKCWSKKSICRQTSRLTINNVCDTKESKKQSNNVRTTKTYGCLLRLIIIRKQKKKE